MTALPWYHEHAALIQQESASVEHAANMQLAGIRCPQNYRNAHHNNPNSADWALAEDREISELAPKYTEVPADEPRSKGAPIGRGIWQ